MSQIDNKSREESKMEAPQHLDTSQIITAVMSFLQLFMTETLVKRMVSLILIAIGVPNARITELTGLCDKSVRTVQKAIATGKIESLFHVGGGGRKSKLEDVENAIIEEIETNNYHSRQQIIDMIQEKYGIKTSLSAVSRLIKKNGVKRLKCGSLPAKADTEKQRSFCDSVLHPLMAQAKKGDITLLFIDASHFVMGCDFLGYIYGKARRFIKTYSGRMRYNVLGALNFVTKKVTTITNDTYITSKEICDLLTKTAFEYAGKPIYFVLDNARYQKCKIVQELASRLKINLIYIPAYSPNLNLIERLWKFAKGQLRTRSYEHFNIFKEKIDTIVNSTNNENKDIINKLINEKIQLFDDLKAINNNTFVSSSKSNVKPLEAQFGEGELVA
jgi:transposase